MTKPTQTAQQLNDYHSSFFINNPRGDYAAQTTGFMEQVKDIYSNRGRSWEKRAELAQILMQQIDPAKIDPSVLVYLHGVHNIVSTHKGIVNGKVKNSPAVKATLDGLTNKYAESYRSRAKDDVKVDASESYAEVKDNVVPITAARTYRDKGREQDTIVPIKVISGASNSDEHTLSAQARSGATNSSGANARYSPGLLSRMNSALRSRAGFVNPWIIGGVAAAIIAVGGYVGWYREAQGKKSYKSSYETTLKDLGTEKGKVGGLQEQVKALDDKYKTDIGGKDKTIDAQKKEIDSLKGEKATLEARLKEAKVPKAKPRRAEAAPGYQAVPSSQLDCKHGIQTGPLRITYEQKDKPATEFKKTQKGIIWYSLIEPNKEIKEPQLIVVPRSNNPKATKNLNVGIMVDGKWHLGLKFDQPYKVSITPDRLEAVRANPVQQETFFSYRGPTCNDVHSHSSFKFEPKKAKEAAAPSRAEERAPPARPEDKKEPPKVEEKKEEKRPDEKPPVPKAAEPEKEKKVRKLQRDFVYTPHIIPSEPARQRCRWVYTGTASTYICTTGSAISERGKTSNLDKN